MTQLTDAPPEAPFAASAATSPARLIGVVSTAHFVSHIYIIILAPLIPYVREAYGVSYTEIGLAIAVFNGVTALLQTPAGFLIDRYSPRLMLVAGLALGGAAFVMVGLVHSYWLLVAMFAIAGVANTVYHPADYAMLSHHIPEQRIGQAFSIHSFGGMMGSAVAPPLLLLLQSQWGWRGAFIGAGLIGFVVAAALLMTRVDESRAAPARKPDKTDQAKDAAPVGWALLMSPPIMLNMLFFILISFTNTGMNNYSVTALGALYGTPVGIANTALTSMLLLTAIGVLAGGVVVTRMPHALVAGGGLFALTVLGTLIGLIDFGNLGIVLVMSVYGFFFGVISPSRDMIVRDATPPGSFGKVFGFVSTGFSIGGIIGPMMFGALMDHGSPQLVFFGVALTALLAVLTVTTIPKRKEAA